MGTAWSWREADVELSGEGQGKVLHPRVAGMEQAAQGSQHSPKLPELKLHLDVLGAPVWNQEPDSVILAGPFHLDTFYDSVCFYKLTYAKNTSSCSHIAPGSHWGACSC